MTREMERSSLEPCSTLADISVSFSSFSPNSSKTDVKDESDVEQFVYSSKFDVKEEFGAEVYQGKQQAFNQDFV